MLKGKWTVQILRAMRSRPVCLCELKRRSPSILQKAITAGLRSLEAAKSILRNDLSKSVLRESMSLHMRCVNLWARYWITNRIGT